MNYFCLSFSYKNTPLELREKIYLKEIELNNFLKDLLYKLPNGSEIMAMSTCNRSEFYALIDDANLIKDLILNQLSGLKGIKLSDLENSARSYVGQEALYHIFSVSASLDSLVLGETQISGQFKDAYNFAYLNNFCGKEITRVVHFALKNAAQIRNKTKISNQNVSISKIAAQKARSLATKNSPNALVIGLGEIGTLCVKHLIKDDFNISVHNRTKKRALALQKELQNKNIEILEQITQDILDFDFIFCATNASAPIIKDELFKINNKKPIFFDLGVPRNIADLADFRIFTIDDLKATAKENMALRQADLDLAHSLVANACDEFLQWIETQELEPVIKEIRLRAKNASFNAIDKAIEKGYFSDLERNNLQKLLHQAFNTFLHEPTQNLRNSAKSMESDVVIEVIKHFFDIDKSVNLLNIYKCEHKG
ncbi:MAG: glutamyl-tRNA reductase [Helicobacter sp.]|nr:glutamyl-tRNA reductase [Helicobacter sp.]